MTYGRFLTEYLRSWPEGGRTAIVEAVVQNSTIVYNGCGLIHNAPDLISKLKMNVNFDAHPVCNDVDLGLLEI